MEDQLWPDRKTCPGTFSSRPCSPCYIIQFPTFRSPLCAAAPPPAAYGAIPSPHPRTQEEDARKLKAALPDGSKLVCPVAFSSRHHGLLSIYHGFTGHTGHYIFFSKNLFTRFRAASSKCGEPYMRFATCRQVSPSTYRSTIIRRTLISRTEDIYSSTSASCS